MGEIEEGRGKNGYYYQKYSYLHDRHTYALNRT